MTTQARFSLQQLLGKGDKFFGLLEASAEEAHASTLALAKVLRDPQHAASLEDSVLMRRKEKRLSEEIGAELVRTFVTGLDRAGLHLRPGVAPARLAGLRADG